MRLELPDDLQALVQKRLARGGYDSAEDVLRRALQAQEEEENWTEEERRALDRKIDRALEQVACGGVFGPEEARAKLKRYEKLVAPQGSERGSPAQICTMKGPQG